MTWLNDLASVLGLPAGAATRAAAMYAGCVAAEKVARPEALSDIGRFILDSNWTGVIRPRDLIAKIFNLTFGDHHLSLKCFVRSALATCTLVSSITIAIFLFGRSNPSDTHLFSWIYDLPLLGIVPDYIALLKTRVLLKLTVPVPILVLLDIGLSLSISLAFFSVVDLIWVIHIYHYTDSISGAFKGFVLPAIPNDLTWMMSPSGKFLVPPVFFMSTLFTSIWTTAIAVAAVALRFITPVQRFTSWFFDVERHPIQAIGIVAGAFTIVGSFVLPLVWTLARIVQSAA